MSSGANAVRECTQWEVRELRFEARRDLDGASFPLSVTFRSGGRGFSVDAFWDGGRVWRVRFALPTEGTWEWHTHSEDAGLGGRSGSIACRSPSAAEVAANPNLRGHLHPDDTGRHLVYADGTPFFYLGDMCPDFLGARFPLAADGSGPFLDRLDALGGRGFSIVQHALFPAEPPAGATLCPFAAPGGRYDFSRLQPEYFRETDRRLSLLWSKGFASASWPTSFATPETPATLHEACRVSRYLLARYGAYNVIWVLSGDYAPGSALDQSLWTFAEAWNELGHTVAAHNAFVHPVTIHPGSSCGRARSSEFRHSGWLTCTWIAGASGPGAISAAVATEYAAKPVRPILVADAGDESALEGTEDPAEPVRAAAWSALLEGACGIACTVPESEDAGGYPAAAQLGRLRGLFSACSWWELSPCRDRLRINGGAPPSPADAGHCVPHAAAAADTVIIYIPAAAAGDTVELLRGAEAPIVCSFNPASGEVWPAEVEITEESIILPGSPGRSEDRVFAAGTPAAALLSV